MKNNRKLENLSTLFFSCEMIKYCKNKDFKTFTVKRKTDEKWKKMNNEKKAEEIEKNIKEK